MTVIGIDPGLSGGLVYESDGQATIATPMPETERDIWDWFVARKGYVMMPPISLILIEKVHSFPKQGVASTFTFGMNYGILRGVIVALGVPYDEVPPQRWQKFFSLPTLKACGDSITAKKNAHKQKAQQLFPDTKVTHAVADALLIAEYARHKMGAPLKRP